jgi:hypothetical protein
MNVDGFRDLIPTGRGPAGPHRPGFGWAGGSWAGASWAGAIRPLLPRPRGRELALLVAAAGLCLVTTQQSLNLAVELVLAYAVLSLSACHGRMVLRLIGGAPTESWSNAESLTVGYLSLSMLMIPAVVVLGLRPVPVFLALAILSLAVRSRQKPQPAAASGDDLLVVLAACVAAYLYCHDMTSDFVATLRTGGILQAHVDFFAHGGIVSEVGDPRAIGSGQMFFSGMKIPLYHFSIFMIPAALTQLTGLRGVDILTIFAVPLGVVLLGMAAAALVRRLSGSLWLSLLAPFLILLPDASRYFLQNVLYDAHFLFLASPGSPYAVALGLVVCATLLATDLSTRARLWLIAFELVVLFNTRAHIFALTGGAVVLFGLGALGARFGALGRALVVPAAAILFAAAAWVATAQTLYPESLQPLLTFDRGFLSGWALDTYDQMLASGLVPAVLFLLVSSVGLPIAIAPVGLVLALLRPCRFAHYALPFCFAVTSGAIILLAPMPSFGDATEYTQRPFVMFYMVVLVWSAVFLREFLVRPLPRPVGATLVGALVALSARWAAEQPIPYGRPLIDSPWFDGAFYVRLSPDVIALSDYLREHSRRHQVFAYLPLAAGDFSIGPAFQIGALSGVPALLSRPGFHLTSPDPARRSEATARLALNERILHEGLDADVVASLRARRVRWVVFDADARPPPTAQNGVAMQAFGSLLLADLDAATRALR